MNKFSHLNIHSQYSISDGLVRLDELSSKAKDLNFESIAITDDSNLFGFVKFYKEMRDKGIKPRNLYKTPTQLYMLISGMRSGG